MRTAIRNKKLVLPELSYEIVGALFDVFHELGSGFHEKHYYRAIQKALEKRGLSVVSQLKVSIEFNDSKIGIFYLDFLVNDQIVLEIKVGLRFRDSDFRQVRAYLKASRKPLAILARFGKDGVTFYRTLPPSIS